VLYVGRLSREKSLDALLDAFTLASASVPEARLVIVGAGPYAQPLEARAGKGRTGDPAAMRRYGEAFGFSVSVAPAIEAAGVKISSSGVRDALRAGHPDAAAALLGRPFAIEGVVQKGRQLGRQLGFPTANVPLGDYVAPRFGAYATRTRLADGRDLPGAIGADQPPAHPVVEGCVRRLRHHRRADESAGQNKKE